MVSAFFWVWAEGYTGTLIFESDHNQLSSAWRIISVAPKNAVIKPTCHSIHHIHELHQLPPEVFHEPRDLKCIQISGVHFPFLQTQCLIQQPSPSPNCPTWYTEPPCITFVVAPIRIQINFGRFALHIHIMRKLAFIPLGAFPELVKLTEYTLGIHSWRRNECMGTMM